MSVTRSDFGSDWEDVRQTWACGGEVNVSSEDAWAALGALERLSPQHLAEFHAQGPQSNAHLSNLISLGSDLLCCEGIPGLAPIIARVDKGDEGARSEFRIAAFFRGLGLNVTLEPEFEGKVLDLAIDFRGVTSYVEVIAPGSSDAIRDLAALGPAAAETIFDVTPRGLRLQIAFLTEPTVSSVEAVAAAVPSLIVAEDVQTVGSVAIARLTPFDEEPAGIELTAGPALGFVRYNQTDKGVRTSADVKFAISDERARRLVEGELHHFAKSAPNMLVIDHSSLPGTDVGWLAPITERTFQPEKNTRLGAVVMCAVAFHGILIPGVLRGTVLENPHAAVPLQRDLLETIGTGFLDPKTLSGSTLPLQAGFFRLKSTPPGSQTL